MTRINPFDALTYVHISGMPSGQLTKQNKHDVQKGLKLGIGNQSAPSSHLITGVRPIVQTTYTYDEDGEINGIDTVADEWILIVDSSSVSWANDDEMRDEVAQVMADYLGVPVSIFNNPNILVVAYDQDGALQFLKDNPIWEGGE